MNKSDCRATTAPAHPSRLWLRGSLALVLLTLALAGCNTVEGVGHDMSDAGRQLDRDASRSNPDHR